MSLRPAGGSAPQELERILTEIARKILDQGEGIAYGALAQALSESSGEVPFEPVRAKQAIDSGACRLGSCGCPSPELTTLASYIDHTLLKPEATLAQIDKLCDEAMTHRFASVCVNGAWVRRCAEVLASSRVLVCSVVGFPLGAMATEAKVYEARHAVEDGACEIDMVLAVGALKSRLDDYVRRDIASVASACQRLGARLKVILETGLLSDEEKVRACNLAQAAGADFVKTSTGFAKGGATVEDILLMRRSVGLAMGVKASGGVRDQPTAQALIAAGATRIGASASVEIVRGGVAASSY